MQTYNDVTDINLPLKALPHRAITESTPSHSVLWERENREKMKNKHIDVALFFSPLYSTQVQWFWHYAQQDQFRIYYDNMVLYSIFVYT